MSKKDNASEVTGSDTSLSVSALSESVDVSGVSGLEDLTNLSNEELLSSLDTAGLDKLKLKGVVEKKQLLHDNQLLRIELSQKSMVIDSLKAQHLSKVEELEEKLYDALHKKQLLHAKLESSMAIQQDDTRKRHEQTQKELMIILDRQRELEQTNKELQTKSLNIRTQLERDCHITEKQYVDLKSQPIDDITIAEYFSMRLYEAMQSTKIERDNLRSQRDKMSSDIAHLSHSLHTTKQKLLEEEHSRSNVELQLKAAQHDLENARNKIQESSGKVQRFDVVLKERNTLDCEVADLVKKHSYLEAENLNLEKQLAELKTEKNKFLQTDVLLKQDKEYLTRNLSECSIKLESCQDQLRRTQDQLERTKAAREELYEKYAASRDEARLSYERRLQTELDRIRIQTDGELEKLRSDAKESYERENRGLREARDLAVQERNQLYKLKEDAEKRCEIFGGEMRALEASIDSRISDFQNEARIKTFELDRLQLVHEETCKNLERLQIQNEKMSRKLELVTTDYGELQRKSTETETQLRSSVKDLRLRLDTYEGIEKELDDIVLQAAEVEISEKDPSEAERVLFSYGFGANIPTSAKHRMKQSVHLARRVLQLEKINSSLHADIQRRDEEMREICSKLKSSNKLLDETRQPYSYLIDSMRKRDDELDQHRSTIVRLEEQVHDLKSDNKELRETKQLLLTDLDRLLSHREELSVMKRVVSNMASPRRQEYDRNFLDSLESKQFSTPAPVRESPRTSKRNCCLAESSSPKPLVFTNHKEHKNVTRANPERYRFMKELINR